MRYSITPGQTHDVDVVSYYIVTYLEKLMLAQYLLAASREKAEKYHKACVRSILETHP